MGFPVCPRPLGYGGRGFYQEKDPLDLEDEHIIQKDPVEADGYLSVPAVGRSEPEIGPYQHPLPELVETVKSTSGGLFDEKQAEVNWPARTPADNFDYYSKLPLLGGLERLLQFVPEGGRPLGRTPPFQ